MKRAILSICLAMAFAASPLAQELTREPTPFSLWIDLTKSEPRGTAWPIWLESVEIDDHLSPDQRSMQRTVRLRLRRMMHLNPAVMLRLQFLDRSAGLLHVSAWSETGQNAFDSGPLGTGLGLPTFEVVRVPLEGADYIDVELKGDGRDLLGLFISSTTEIRSQAALDFSGAAPAFVDPFGNSPAPKTPHTDTELLGRVRALLIEEPVILSELNRTIVLEFELEEAPIVAVLDGRILNVDIARPPQVIVNDRPAGVLALQLPDLADPAYRGTARPLEAGLRMRYAGWLATSCAIPGGSLRPGINRIEIRAESDAEAVAIRGVGLQLKYNAPTFDYDLDPIAY